MNLLPAARLVAHRPRALPRAWTSGAGWTLLLGAVSAAALSFTPAMARAQASSEAPARVIVKLRAGSVRSGTAAAAQALDAGEGTSSAASLAADRTRLSRLVGRLGLSLHDGWRIGGQLHVAQARGLTSSALARQLAAQPDVEYAVVDEKRYAAQVAPVTPHDPPHDPLYGPGLAFPYPAVGQWYLKAPDSTLVSAIDAPGAWAVTQGSSAVVVAVIDSGVRYDHADLNGKLLPGYNFISDAMRAGNATGRSSDASDLGDSLTSVEIRNHPGLYAGCSASNSGWHGSLVSGIVGAQTDNSLGVAGLGWNVKVLPVRVLGKCGGYDSDIIAGMRWAAGLSVAGVPANLNPAQVLNLSLGGTGNCSSAYLDAINQIRATGAVVVVAAGNSAGQAVGTPANCAGVIAVGGLRHVGTKVGYSAVGTEVALSAPGGNCVNSEGSPCLYAIVSTKNSGSSAPVSDVLGGSVYSDADYNINGSGKQPEVGTSFAAPIVSATAALMLSVNPSLTPDNVRSILTTTVRAFPTTGGTNNIPVCQPPGISPQDECYCTTQTCGAGMLDARQAVLAAASGVAVARIAANPPFPSPGATVTLTGSGYVPDPTGNPNSVISSYVWQLVDGGGVVSSLTDLSGSPGPQVSAVTTGTGYFTVQLTVTDAGGRSASTRLQVKVGNPAPLVITPLPVAGTEGSGGGGGGGALDAGSLAALSAAVAALAWGRFRKSPSRCRWSSHSAKR